MKMINMSLFRNHSLVSTFVRLNRILGKLSVRTLFIQPAPDHIPTTTTADMIREFGNVHGVSNALESIGHGSPGAGKARLPNPKILLPQKQSELPARRMQDSFVTAIIPLSRDSLLRDHYTTFFGSVRIGRLLEDLDIFAAWACYKHVVNPKAEGSGGPVGPVPFSLVTALVDRVIFSGERMKADEDIRLSGHVSWVGRSSMEVALLVDQKSERGWTKLTSAKVVYVARDPTTNGPAFVNALVGETDEEKKYIQCGYERSQQRKFEAQQSLERKAPTEEERELIHKLFVSTQDPSYGGFRPANANYMIPPNTRFMESSRLNTLVVCHPQYRNIFNKIFGGLIMRKAFELAFANAYLYTKSRPTIITIDDIVFRRPVEIGSLLRFGAEVAFVENNYVHIPVIAEVLHPETGENQVTNIFHFTFRVDGPAPPNLLPNTYQEAMIYLNSRRRFKLMKEYYYLSSPKE